MKKTIYLLAILTIAALLFTACKSTDILDDPSVQQQDQPTTNSQTQTDQQPGQTDQNDQQTAQVNIPADTYTIKATDSADKFIMNYKIDPDNKWKVKTATFEIRNFGDEPLNPKITFMVGGGDDIKTFEYDSIPPGYKMIKQESVNMDVVEEHIFIKATLSNADTGREIESVNLDYFAG